MNSLDTLARLFIRTVAANLFMLVVTIRFYADSFSLARDPFSWLGQLVTDGGDANTRAFLLFSATALFNACVWRRVLSVLPAGRTGRHVTVCRLGRAVLAGFILMAFPCDRFDAIHSTGAALVVGGLWAFTTGMLYRMRDRLGTAAHIGLQLFLHGAALFCAVTFVLDSALKGFSQRPLLAAIIAEMGICLNAQLHHRPDRDLTFYGSGVR